MNSIEIIEGPVKLISIKKPTFGFEGPNEFKYYKVATRVSDGQEKLERLSEPCNFIFTNTNGKHSFPILFGRLDEVDEGEILTLVVGIA